MKNQDQNPNQKNRNGKNNKKRKPCFLKRIFGEGYRRDGTLAQTDYFQKFLPYIIRRRSEAMIFMDMQLDMTHAMEYLGQKKAQSNGSDSTLITPFTLIVAATQRLAIEKPRMNRFIAGKRIFDRNSIEICYVIKTTMNENGQEVVVKESFSPDDTLLDVAKKIHHTKNGTRKFDAGSIDSSMKFLSRLPRFMLSSCFIFLRFLNWFDLVPLSVIKNDALYASAFISNVGSIGAHAPYHHLFDMGTTSVFIAVGLIRKSVILQDDASIAKKDILDIRFTIDDRIADGFYYVKAIDLFKKYVENPELMEQPPCIIHTE
jgi:hypothetical protein